VVELPPTAADNMTVCPTEAGFGEADKAVALIRPVTVSLNGAEVAAPKFGVAA
jgi:hypothetical protein